MSVPEDFACFFFDETGSSVPIGFRSENGLFFRTRSRAVEVPESARPDVGRHVAYLAADNRDYIISSRQSLETRAANSPGYGLCCLSAFRGVTPEWHLRVISTKARPLRGLWVWWTRAERAFRGW